MAVGVEPSTRARFINPMNPTTSCFVHCVLWVYCVAYGRQCSVFNSCPFHQPNEPKKLNKLNKLNKPYSSRTFVCWDARMLGSQNAAICFKPSATLQPLYHPRTLKPSLNTFPCLFPKCTMVDHPRIPLQMDPGEPTFLKCVVDTEHRIAACSDIDG